MTLGYLLVGHGTRNERGREEFLELADAITAMLQPKLVQAAFLELAEPAIEQAMVRLRDAGATEIVCAPIILLAAAHVKRDIPAAVDAAAARHGIEQVRYAEHLGCREAMLEVSLARFHVAINASQSDAPAAWLLVGRGTRDEQALAEIDRFMALREEREPTPHQWLGFLAMAEPMLQTALESAAESAAKTIVVQPHLLFQGDLLDRTRAMVAEMAARYPAKSWVLAKHLGPDPAIARSVADQLLDFASE